MSDQVLAPVGSAAAEIEVEKLPIQNGVLMGHNNELYLMGGAHWILQFALGKATLEAQTLETFWRNIDLRRRVSDRFGARYIHLIAPEKYVVLPENMPFQARGHMAGALLDAGLPDDVVYPLAALRAGTAGRSYCYTDSHWSVPGRVTIATLIAERAGLADEVMAGGSAALAAAMNGPPAPAFAGDLGRKFTPAVQERAILFRRGYGVTTVENGLEHIGDATYNEGRLFVATSAQPTAADATLLIFGDSYLHLTLEFLAAFFRRIVFCRTRHLHDEMVSLVRPTMIVTENAERYLDSVADDRAVPAFLLMPYLMQRKPVFEINAAKAIAEILRSNREI